MSPIRIAVLTVSDGVNRGTREDRSGAALAAWAKAAGHTLVAHAVVADERDRITAALLRLVEQAGAEIVLTTGGTGLGPRDVTPEATRPLLEREAPGLAEALRAHGAASTAHSWLSRGVAGTRGGTLIVNLPGSEGAVRDAISVLGPLLPHAVQLLRNIDPQHHPQPDV